MDFVLMGVPRHLAQDVADLIANETVSVSGNPGMQLINGWTEETVRRAYRESKDNMRKLLEHLAAHPDQEFGTPEIAAAIGVPDWNSIAGMLGPFTRRYQGRYKMSLPPWIQRTDSDDRDHLKMPGDLAAIVRDEAGI
jgi:hypothetical protein